MQKGCGSREHPLLAPRAPGFSKSAGVQMSVLVGSGNFQVRLRLPAIDTMNTTVCVWAPPPIYELVTFGGLTAASSTLRTSRSDLWTALFSLLFLRGEIRSHPFGR